MRLVAARLTREVGLVLPVGLLSMTAGATGLAGVLRVDQDHRHTGRLGLVDDEPAQLEEGPIAQPSPHLLASRGLDATADAGEVLQGDPHAECLRLGDELLADLVVGLGLEPPLPARHPLEPALGPAAARALILLPRRVPASPVAVDGRSGERLTLAVHGEVDNPEIHPEEVLGFGRLGDVLADLDMEEVASISVLD